MISKLLEKEYTLTMNNFMLQERLLRTRYITANFIIAIYSNLLYNIIKLDMLTLI